LSDSSAYPETPAGWSTVARRQVGPFTTHVTYRQPDGTTVGWSSRVHRKHGSLRSRIRERDRGVWWAPRRASWWIGVLFAVGSACFFVGPFPGFVELVGSTADGLVFFVGSLFFTSAAVLQYLEAVNADRGPGATARRLRVHVRAATHRLVELRRPGRRDPPVQRRHLPRAADGVRLAVIRPARMGARRSRLRLLPRRVGAPPARERSRRRRQ
jgi:hypothetical protein